MVQLSGRTGGFLLMGSLAVNLFLGGAIIGNLFGENVGPRFAPPPKPRREFKLDRLRDSLSPEGRVVFQTAVDRYRDRVKDKMDGVKAGHRRLRETVASENLDLAALENALNDLFAQQDAARHIVLTALLELMPQLSADDRVRLAAQPPFVKPGKRHRGFPPPPMD